LPEVAVSDGCGEVLSLTNLQGCNIMSSVRFSIRGAVVCAAVSSAVLGASVASATVITFGALAGANGSNYTTYTESGFTYAKTAGSGCVGQVFGNPTPDIFGGPTCDGGTTGSFTLTGGTFFFNGIDLAANNGLLTYSLVGKLGAATVWTQAGTLAGPTASFSTIAGLNPLSSVNSVLMTFSTQGTSWNIDNINVRAVPVPEPTTLLMACAGVAFILTRRRPSA
jgi:PEP-CTERM motif